MHVVADTHGHLYPEYDAARLFHGARDRLARLAQGRSRPGQSGFRLVICLVERAGDSVFEALRADSLRLPGLRLEPCESDAEALCIRFSAGPPLWVCSGRQFAAAEGLEAIALGARSAAPDGRPLEEILRGARGLGAAVVLPWGAGKWVGGRGRIVRELLGRESPETLLLGDNSLRPAGFPCRLMRLGVARGFRMVAGSDPLPVPGEESVAGGYAASLEGAWDDERPARSLVRLLADPSVPLRTVGRRSMPWAAALRWMRSMLRGRSDGLSFAGPADA